MNNGGEVRHAIIFDMTSFALLFTLAAIGISETSYLIRKRIALERPVCPIGGNCVTVLNSRWSRMFLVPNDVLGLLFYVSVSFLSAFLVIGLEPISFWQSIMKASVLFGSVFSAFLFYLQWKVIRAWCFWCVMSAITIWLMGLIILLSK